MCNWCAHTAITQVGGWTLHGRWTRDSTSPTGTRYERATDSDESGPASERSSQRYKYKPPVKPPELEYDTDAVGAAIAQWQATQEVLRQMNAMDISGGGAGGPDSSGGGAGGSAAPEGGHDMTTG